MCVRVCVCVCARACVPVFIGVYVCARTKYACQINNNFEYYSGSLNLTLSSFMPEQFL